jgi:hypothetical protein
MILTSARRIRMDWKSYEDGKLGIPPGPNTDMDSYMAGKQGGEMKTGVPGVAFTILIMAPFLFLVYPVLGLSLLAITLAALAAVAWAPIPMVLKAVAGLILYVAAFFPAYKVERKASQIAPYRMLRKWFRLFNAFVATVLMRSGAAFSGSGIDKFDFNKAPPDTLFFGIAVAILVHFVFRTLDRLYFPVHAEVRKIRDMAAKGIPLQRRSRTRLWYSLLWVVPFVAILNLIIRGFVSGVTDSPQERVAFYQQYSVFVYGIDFLAWFTCCAVGILPGTGKRVKSFVDYTVDT